MGPVASVAIDVFENSLVPKADASAIDGSRHPKLVVSFGRMIRMISGVLDLKNPNRSAVVFNTSRYKFKR